MGPHCVPGSGDNEPPRGEGRGGGRAEGTLDNPRRAGQLAPRWDCGPTAIDTIRVEISRSIVGFASRRLLCMRATSIVPPHSAPRIHPRVERRFLIRGNGVKGRHTERERERERERVSAPHNATGGIIKGARHAAPEGKGLKIEKRGYPGGVYKSARMRARACAGGRAVLKNGSPFFGNGRSVNVFRCVD